MQPDRRRQRSRAARGATRSRASRMFAGMGSLIWWWGRSKSARELVTQTDRITLASGISMDPVNHCILVVADPDGQVADFDEFSNDEDHFRNLVLGVVTHGLA